MVIALRAMNLDRYYLINDNIRTLINVQWSNNQWMSSVCIQSNCCTWSINILFQQMCANQLVHPIDLRLHSWCQSIKALLGQCTLANAHWLMYLSIEQNCTITHVLDRSFDWCLLDIHRYLWIHRIHIRWQYDWVPGWVPPDSGGKARPAPRSGTAGVRVRQQSRRQW